MILFRRNLHRLQIEAEERRQYEMDLNRCAIVVQRAFRYKKFKQNLIRLGAERRVELEYHARLLQCTITCQKLRRYKQFKRSLVRLQQLKQQSFCSKKFRQNVYCHKLAQSSIEKPKLSSTSSLEPVPSETCTTSRLRGILKNCSTTRPFNSLGHETVSFSAKKAAQTLNEETIYHEANGQSKASMMIPEDDAYFTLSITGIIRNERSVNIAIQTNKRNLENYTVKVNIKQHQ